MQKQNDVRFKMSQKTFPFLLLALCFSPFKVEAVNSCLALFKETGTITSDFPANLNFFSDAVRQLNRTTRVVLLTPDQLDALDLSFQVIDTRSGRRLTAQEARASVESSILVGNTPFTLYSIDQTQIPPKQLKRRNASTVSELKAKAESLGSDFYFRFLQEVDSLSRDEISKRGEQLVSRFAELMSELNKQSPALRMEVTDQVSKTVANRMTYAVMAQTKKLSLSAPDPYRKVEGKIYDLVTMFERLATIEVQAPYNASANTLQARPFFEGLYDLGAHPELSPTLYPLLNDGAIWSTRQVAQGAFNRANRSAPPGQSKAGFSNPDKSNSDIRAERIQRQLGLEFDRRKESDWDAFSVLKAVAEHLTDQRIFSQERILEIARLLLNKQPVSYSKTEVQFLVSKMKRRDDFVTILVDLFGFSFQLDTAHANEILSLTTESRKGFWIAKMTFAKNFQFILPHNDGGARYNYFGDISSIDRAEIERVLLNGGVYNRRARLAQRYGLQEGPLRDQTNPSLPIREFLNLEGDD